ncbi:MAG: CBS domain-containing protein [Phycisphaerae bacterium]|nr:CBS domain-containing protein [Phycisphaerae bacterium]
MTSIRNLLSCQSLTLEPQMPIEQAMVVMRQKGATSSVVLNDDDTVAGVLTESDIIKMFVEPSDGGIEGTSVADFMTKDVTTEPIDSDIDKISRVFLGSHFRQIPVVFGDIFVGIITRKDLIKYVTKFDN